MMLSTLFPYISQSGAGRRANSSMRGDVPHQSQNAAVGLARLPAMLMDNDVVFPYRPNISFTTRSAPFTNPVRISMLKIN